MMDLVMLPGRSPAGHPETADLRRCIDQWSEDDQGNNRKEQFTEQTQQEQLLFCMLMGRKLLTVQRKSILIVLVKRMGMRDHISA